MKDFTLYPEAFELKQLGFNEPCLGYYIANTLFISNDNVYNSTDIPVIKAPLYSQAFRWFREKHFLVAILFNDDGDSDYGNLRYNWEIRTIIESFKTYDEKVANCFVGKYTYKTYEEAELACLKEMIKLLKNEK